MTAESITYHEEPRTIVLQAIGSMTIQRFSGENLSPESRDIVIDLPPAMTPEGAEARSFGIAATLVKSKFESIKGNLKADEREVQRDKAREESVRMLFKTFGMLPNTDSVNTPFSRVYREVEASMESRDMSEVGDLVEKYDTNPAVAVLKKLQSVAHIPSEDIIFMRRIILVMIDEHTASQ